MFIAMNRFKVVPGSEAEFETMWLSRESYLHELPGFVSFHMLRGPKQDDHTLYSSHTVWATKADFEGWTKSEAFRRSHARVPGAQPTKPLYLGHPNFEGFDVIQTIEKTPSSAAA